MDNLLPEASGIAAIASRQRQTTSTWQPDRSEVDLDIDGNTPRRINSILGQDEYKLSSALKGTSLTKTNMVLRDLQVTDQPNGGSVSTALVTSTRPLPNMATSQALAERPAEGETGALVLHNGSDPSPLGLGLRGSASTARISKLARPEKPAAGAIIPTHFVGQDRDPPTVTFVNDTVDPTGPNAQDGAGAMGQHLFEEADREAGYAYDGFVDVYMKGEKTGGSMSHREIGPGGRFCRTIAGGTVGNVGAGPKSEAVLAAMQERGVTVLAATRGRLGVAAVDVRAEKEQAEEENRDMTPSHQIVINFDAFEPMGLELEQHYRLGLVLVHRCHPDGQADRLGVPPKVVVQSVGTTKINSLAEFEDAVMGVKDSGAETLQLTFMDQQKSRNILKEASRTAKQDADRAEWGDVASCASSNSAASHSLAPTTSDVHSSVAGSFAESKAEGKDGENERAAHARDVAGSFDSTTVDGDKEGGGGGWNFATGGGVGYDDDEQQDAYDDDEKGDGYGDGEYGGDDGLMAGRMAPDRSEPKGHPEVPQLPVGLSSSQDDRIPVTLYFVNHSVHMQMEVSWVDYDGRVVPRKVLGPGDALLERSFATHPWVVHSVAPPPVEGTIFTDPGTIPHRVGLGEVRIEDPGYHLHTYSLCFPSRCG
mmetsp:Transcript_71137/g.199972  ORF Transcript_71137/g.199972 Transcript_71137/m.199972 type:complete len:651 (+) Transcript_71137:156-2108(+)